MAKHITSISELYLYDALEDCARDTVRTIEDDEEFCIAEWDLFRDWYDERGFTEDDWEYVEACGYNRYYFEEKRQKETEDGWRIICEALARRY